jgi:hypothetical protein
MQGKARVWTRMATMAMLLVGTTVHAEIYRMVDGQGNVTFTDTPVKGAQRMQLPPLSIVPGLTPEQIAQANGQTAAAEPSRVLSYRLSVVAPKANQTFIKPNDTIEIGAVTQPQLANGDRVVILFNGKPLGEGNSAAVPTESLDRGEHRVVVQVVSGAGRVMTSEERVVYVQQPTAQHGARHP